MFFPQVLRVRLLVPRICRLYGMAQLPGFIFLVPLACANVLSAALFSSQVVACLGLGQACVPATCCVAWVCVYPESPRGTSSVYVCLAETTRSRAATSHDLDVCRSCVYDSLRCSIHCADSVGIFIILQAMRFFCLWHGMHRDLIFNRHGHGMRAELQWSNTLVSWFITSS